VIPKKIFEPYNLAEPGTGVSATDRQASGLGEADLALSADNVHWGFFSKELEPVLTVTSLSVARLDYQPYFT
jgi:hypothetical protein